MISSKNLRLNNFVLYDGKCETISAIYQYYVKFWEKDKECRVDKLIPIDLSDKILELCGFVKSEKSEVWIKLINYLDSETYQTTLQKVDDGTISICRSGIKVTDTYCKHLHELQNLYFVLLNKELEIDIDELDKLI